MELLRPIAGQAHPHGQRHPQIAVSQGTQPPQLLDQGIYPLISHMGQQSHCIIIQDGPDGTALQGKMLLQKRPDGQEEQFIPLRLSRFVEAVHLD